VEEERKMMTNSDVIQSVVVKKIKAGSIKEAAKIAGLYNFGGEIFENKTSYRIPQRRWEDFKEGSLRTKKVNEYVSLVYGEVREEV